MKYFFLSYLFVAAIVVAAFGTRGSKSELPPIEILPDMDYQQKVKYQAKSDFFADGLGARRPVAGTVPMGFEVPAKPASSPEYQPPAFGFSHGTGYYNTGKFGDYYGDGLPKEIELSKSLLERGERQYNIYCAVCHAASGNGKGVTSKYGILTAFNFQQPGSLDPANAAAYRADGAMFDVISNGKGLMGPYGGSISVQDRWAIVAYIRAMQVAVKENNVSVQ
ncbi:MAG TPA: quinol:cytochrome C oxidoreductase [Verrucomicrobiales bacterium]|mgnify:CR=1 FL=1|nr:quinol:cytochrome C oxidoreductase [Verrucomicrobiales bacterium]HRJ07201.1 cytochrome c [Prosthecobacter sp.]HRK14287.1 cytochrome c [Prosthecobacter sp.]